MPRRELEVPIHNDTLKSLIDNYLQTNKVIRYYEEITDFSLSAPDKDGVRTIRFIMEPDVQTIQHE